MAISKIPAAGIAADAITAAKLGDNVINSEHYAADSIDAEHLAPNSVNTDSIIDDAVRTAHIQDSQVTVAKLAANSVDSSELINGSVDRVHLAADIVDGTKIADDVINSEHLVAGSIDTEHLGDDQVTAAKLANSINSAIAANTSKTGITSSQTSAITANTAKTGITSSQATAITAALPKSGGTMTGNIAHAGTFTLDVGGDLILDADGGGFLYKDGGTEIGRLFNSSNDFVIKSAIANGDFKIQGNDGGSAINALVFDMSAAGAATFNSSIALAGDIYLANNSILRSGGEALIARYDPVIEIGSGDGDDYLKFKAGAAERMRILTNGNVGIGTASIDERLHVQGGDHERIQIESTVAGDAVIIHKNSANYWKVGATASIGGYGGDGKYAVSDGNDVRLAIHPSTGYVSAVQGLVFGTDTAAANALDDYEEGSWNPYITTTAGVYTTSARGMQGKYTKIGNQVTCWFAASITTPTGGSGQVKINNLPYTCNAPNITVASQNFRFGRVTLETSGMDYVGLIPNGTSSIFFSYMATNANNVDMPAGALNQTTPYIDGCVTYMTSS